MLIAHNKNKERINPAPNQRGICPGCGSEVMAKCGTINVWHWSHVVGEDCDSWYEPESFWHKWWKEKYPKEMREIVIKNHRADVKTSKGVIELQSSPISEIELGVREVFYKNMIWLLNGEEFNLDIRNRGNYVSFRWKHPRKSFFEAEKPIFIDLGGQVVLQIKKIHPVIPCGGWGYLISHEEFLRRTL